MRTILLPSPRRDPVLPGSRRRALPIQRLISRTGTIPVVATTREGTSGAGVTTLQIGKLAGVPPQVRRALKGRRIATCGQLLAAVGEASRREALAKALDLDPEVLLRLTRSADMARVKGLGIVFGAMLEGIGVRDVQTLAAQEPEPLHARLHTHNQEERLARRSPTLAEVRDWVGQARALPGLVSY